MGVLQEARRLHRLGFKSVPTRRGKKSPAVEWTPFQTKPTDDYIEGWWGAGSQFTGIWTLTGSPSGIVVLDTDSPEAEAWWRGQIGAEMDETCCSKTAKGHHYWFAIAPGEVIESWAVKDGNVCFDVKADGGGVMTPPSPHPGGGYYEWVREPEALREAPSLLLDGGRAVRGALAAPVTTGANGDTSPVKGDGRSLLSSLLAQVPDEGERNNWLIKVAGHYAKILPYHDVYLMLVNQANEKMATPLDQDEVDKTAESAWKAEVSKGLTTQEALQEQGIVSGVPSDLNGWLLGTGNSLMCPCLVKDGDNKAKVLRPWADFDITVLGVIQQELTTDYLVRMQTHYRTIECRLDGHILGSGRDLTVWLAEKQASIVSPVGDEYGRVAESRRLLRYVQSQKAPVFHAVEALGWQEDLEGYLVHEGIIRAGATEAVPFGDVRPNPILADWAPYRYGFAGTQEDAQAVLREVLTFHDPTVTAVYGAWWAACYLKVQVMEEASLFPFMALAAPSESGKTVGFFALMMQLGGNYEGHGEYTMAVLRDRISAHRNGAVWVDDMSQPEIVWDLVRQATSEGSRTKKGDDRHHQERVSLVAPIVISAEGLAALSTEKALADRAIKLSVPSPTGRMSLHDPERPQFDDIKDLQYQYQGDLTKIAGHFVSLALGCTGLVRQLRELRPVQGRHGDKLGILRVGARVLAQMCGDDSVIERVDAWCLGQTYAKGDNILTTEILPWSWRQSLYPESASGGRPVFVKDGIVWFNIPKLVDQWDGRHTLSPRQRQLGSADSIQGQRRDLGIDGTGKAFATRGVRDGQLRYHALPPAMSALVIDRAGRVTDDDDALPL